MALSLLLAGATLAPAMAQPGQSFEDRFDRLGLTGLDTIDGNKWDVSVHSRAIDTWLQLQPMQGAHGLDTAPPPATHTITEYEDAVYVAREHLMTAIRADAYGLIYLTPTALADWSDGECVIRFEVSTLRTSRRDWIDVWLTPWEDNMVLPLQEDLPDLQGNPRRGLQFRMGTWNTTDQGSQVDWSHMQAVRYDGYQETILPSSVEGYEKYVTPDARQRETIEIRISPTHVRIGMPDYGLWWVDAEVQELGFSRAVVQFGHHSYNPEKPGTVAPIAHDTALAGTGDPSPNSWHWDAFSIRPALPFKSIPGDRRYVLGSDIQPVTFAEPAPKHAHLRFAAHGDAEVSFDGGPWAPAERQDGSREFLNGHEDGFFASFWTPIPEGTTSVRVRLTPRGIWAQYNLETMAKDFSIWQGPQVLTVPGGADALPGPVLPRRR